MLPVLTKPPVVTPVSSSSVEVVWTSWEEEVDLGDPPLVGYTVFYRRSHEWQTNPMVAMTQDTVDDLEPNTEYEFSVAAVREGLGGTGPMSESTTAWTFCGSK